ncbi:uncharacterized protein [Medicago truncatula]|nr:uncharacterized protein LOC25481933 isoform X4 [Medicago truncatula]
MKSNMAICTPAPNFVGAQLNDGCQPIPPFLDSLKSNEYLPITQSTQIPTNLLKEHECIKKKNVKTGLLGKDVTSSNIELRLGQPPWAGNLVDSFVESPLFTFASSPKLHSLMQMTNNLSREEELQNSFSRAAGSFEMPLNYMSGCSINSDAAIASSQTDNVATSSLFLPFPQFSSQPKGTTNACKNLVNGGIMPMNLHSEYDTVQFGSSNVDWNSNGHKGRQSNDSALEFNKYLDNDNGERFGEDSCTKVNSGFEVNQFMEFGSIRRTIDGSGSCTPVVNRKIYESSFPSDTSVGANALLASKNVSSFGRNNHLTLGTVVPFVGNLKSLPYPVSSSASNQNPTSLQQQGINMDTCMIDENTRLLPLTQMPESSKQQQALYFHDMNQKLGKSGIAEPQNYIYKASVPELGSSGASLKFPQNRGTCGNLEITDGLNRYCDFSALTPTPLQSKQKESQCKNSYDLQNDGPYLSLGMTRSSRKCSEKQSDVYLLGKYVSAARENCCRNNVCTGIGPSCDTAKEKYADVNGVTSFKIASECGRDQNAPKNKNIYFDPSGLGSHGTVKNGSHTPQWRDVPSKIRKPSRDTTLLDQMATVFEGQDGAQVGNISAKPLEKIIGTEALLKEQDFFYVSSGCSAPVVYQASVMEANKVNSYTVDPTNAGCIEKLVRDEGSGIDKGWSSDLIESERSAEFAGSTIGSDLKKGYLRILNDQPCQSLLDDIKLLDSLIWKKRQDQNHIIVSADCRTNPSQKVKGFKGKKQKRNEARIPDASLLPGISSSSDNQNGTSAGAFDPPSSLSEEMQFYHSTSQQRSANKAYIVQPNTNHKLSSFPSEFPSCKNHLNKRYNDEDSYESESISDVEFHTLPGISRMKKSRKDLASDFFGQFQTQETSHEEPNNAKQISSSSRKGSAHRIKRVVVCGKYGEICSELSITEVPKPAKIVSLSEVLRTSKRCSMVPPIETPRLTTKKKWRRLGFGKSLGHSCTKSGLKAKKDDKPVDTIVCNETISMEGFESGNKQNVYKQKKDTNEWQSDIVHRAYSPLKVKSRKIQKLRSINEITAKETQMLDILEYAEDHELDLCNKRSKISVQEHTDMSFINSDSFCCVRRRPISDELNSSLKCNKCLIKVHQDCYGIKALPERGCWCCRPCQTNSKDINLLLNETEGINDEKVEFYGRCGLHGIGPECQSAYDPTDVMGSRAEKEFTCARAEGYKGRRWDGIYNNHCSALKRRGGCLIPDEQLNAWIHINVRKLRSQGIPKFPDSDIEHDPRKEYAWYKQVKGWKNLVVYKSGIHGLGLYTSQCIYRGRMVVEYVGEIVGQRVADKREIEYISGRKLQYKSACYFFKIDKEHIIDATRKGGIARFVNHSCLPNCAAKVITVRRLKKVVFFAERDILPGEEITYDYNFNREDDEKKIPCYCNSKNCRRSLN